MKTDELALWDACWQLRPKPGQDTIYAFVYPDITSLIGMHPNRAFYLLGKWGKRDLWNWGVSARSGWFTEKARENLADVAGSRAVLRSLGKREREDDGLECFGEVRTGRRFVHGHLGQGCS